MSTLKTDAIEAATGTNTDLDLAGKGTGVPDIATGFKVGGTAGVPVNNLRTGTDGELITWDASGDPATVAVGTATHVLTSNGVGAAPTFQAAAAGGAWTFISATTCSGETEVDFTLTSTYKTYIIVLSAVGGTIGSFLMRLSTDGGSSFDTGDNYRTFRGYNYSQDTASREDGDGGGGGPEMKLGVIETGTDNSFSGILYIAGHQQTGDTCTIFGRYVAGRTDQAWEGGWWFGGYEPTTNVDAIRLYPSSTSFTHGRITLFGLTTA